MKHITKSVSVVDTRLPEQNLEKFYIKNKNLIIDEIGYRILRKAIEINPVVSKHRARYEWHVLQSTSLRPSEVWLSAGQNYINLNTKSGLEQMRRRLAYLQYEIESGGENLKKDGNGNYIGFFFLPSWRTTTIDATYDIEKKKWRIDIPGDITTYMAGLQILSGQSL